MAAMLPRAVSRQWCARAPAAPRRLAAAGLQRRGFLPTPGDLQKAIEDAQKALTEAGLKAKEEADKAAKVINENLGSGAEQGKQALEQTQQEVLQKAQEALSTAQQEVLQRAQEALEKAKEEADRAAQVINETLQQAAKGQPGMEAVADQKVHVVKGLEVAAEQGAQFVNAALAAAGSPQRFGGGDAAVAESSGAGRPPEGSSLFWSPDAPDSPSKVGRDTFIATCKSQATDVGTLVPEADVEQYVDFLLASAVLTNSALPQALGRQLYSRVVRLTQRGIMAMMSGLEGEVLGKQLRLLWQPSPLNAFRQCEVAAVDPRLVKCLAKRALGDKANGVDVVPAYLADLGLDAEKVQELYEDVVALTVRILMDVGLTKQIRCLGHEITINIRPDEALHTAPGWESSLEEGIFGLFGGEEKEKFAKEFVESAMEDPAFQMKGLPKEAQREMYISVVKVLLSLSEVAMNHFRIHVAGMAVRPCLTAKEPAEASAEASAEAAPSASP